MSRACQRVPFSRNLSNGLYFRFFYFILRSGLSFICICGVQQCEQSCGQMAVVAYRDESLEYIPGSSVFFVRSMHLSWSSCFAVLQSASCAHFAPPLTQAVILSYACALLSPRILRVLRQLLWGCKCSHYQGVAVRNHSFLPA